MDRTERFYKIRRRLLDRGALTRREIEEELEISQATFKRDIEYMRDRLNVPIIWSQERQAYLLDPEADVEELPGVWFSPGEIYALLEAEHLLGQLQPGLLGAQMKPLRERLGKLLDSGELAGKDIRRRIRVLTMGTRRVGREVFESLSVALLNRRRLSIRHLKRQTGEEISREVSPLRMVHYRYNWYLDAWCHMRDGLRVFSVDAISSARVLDEAAIERPDEDLDRELGAGYGIFAGAAVNKAILRFTPARARWVADEFWHSRQAGRIDADGSYVLELPYSQSPELVMDLLRHGAGVEVIGPPALREAVAAELEAALRQYRG